MSTYNFDIKLETKNFEVSISTSDSYGYFEHKTRGDDCAGGMRFDGKELVDYDGVFELPKEVVMAIKEVGYVFDEGEEDVAVDAIQAKPAINRSSPKGK